MSEVSVHADQMVVEIARLLVNSRNAFHGLASPIPAIAIALARELYNPSLEYLNITGGVNVHPASQAPSTCGPAYWEGSESFFSLTDIFDLCARGELDTAFLSGVQIDRYGNLNNSVIGSFSAPKVRLPGGAGSAAVVPHAEKTIAWRTHDSRTFVETCDFITAAGNVCFVITPLSVFEGSEEGLLKLLHVYPFSNGPGSDSRTFVEPATLLQQPEMYAL